VSAHNDAAESLNRPILPIFSKRRISIPGYQNGCFGFSRKRLRQLDEPFDATEAPVHPLCDGACGRGSHEAIKDNLAPAKFNARL
jgi:hypothetical protein